MIVSKTTDILVMKFVNVGIVEVQLDGEYKNVVLVATGGMSVGISEVFSFNTTNDADGYCQVGLRSLTNNNISIDANLNEPVEVLDTAIIKLRVVLAGIGNLYVRAKK